MEFFRGGVPSNGRASLTFMLQGLCLMPGLRSTISACSRAQPPASMLRAGCTVKAWPQDCLEKLLALQIQK
jgi:hypothetical protein